MRRRATLVPLLLAALILAFPAAARAQGLQGKISELFIFGPGEEPLFLAGTADPNNPTAIRVHGRHFVPAAATENGSIIDFITSAISANISNVPIGSTGGGETFHFEGGVPVKTSTSAGPIFGERGQTIGRGRVLAGLSRSGFHFTSLRGVDLHDIALNFTHENVNFEGCSEAQGADCALMGVPNLENDVIQFRLSLDIDVRVTSLYLTYGIADRVDVAAVIPVVETSMRGRSDAQVVPFGGPTATHFFAGTPTNPVLAASRTSDGSSFGLGDVALRLKTNVHETPRTSVALLADARLPTGAKDDLLGSGTFAARGLAIVSTRVGDLSPHVNVGYFFRAGDTQNDAVLATLGFDDRLVGIVTLAADLVSELQVGQSHLTLPQPVTYDAPFHRVVQPTSIPDTRDDIINGSFGIKIGGGSGAIGVLNALFPLNRGGMRPNVVYTAGVEYSF